MTKRRAPPGGSVFVSAWAARIWGTIDADQIRKALRSGGYANADAHLAEALIKAELKSGSRVRSG